MNEFAELLFEMSALPIGKLAQATKSKLSAFVGKSKRQFDALKSQHMATFQLKCYRHKVAWHAKNDCRRSINKWFLSLNGICDTATI